MRLLKLVDCIDIKINEGIHVKDIQISSIEPNTEDTVEVEEEKVQELEKEDSESDDESTNIQEESKQQTKTKTPFRIVQKNHPENRIIGDKNKGVQIRRKLIKDSKQSRVSFLSMIEPNNFE